MGIYAKWAELVGEVGYIQKTGDNTFHKYRYTTEGDFLDAVRPVMVRLGLVFYPSKAEVIPTSSTSTLITIKYVYTLVDSESGESVDMEVVAQGSDSQDKGAYKAATGARKYALRQLILAGTGDDPEEDDDSDARGVVNSNAIPVIRRLKDAGFLTAVRIESDINYSRLTEFMGIELKKIPNTGKGTDALRQIFAFAVEYGKSGDSDDKLITNLGISVRETLGKAKTASV